MAKVKVRIVNPPTGDPTKPTAVVENSMLLSPGKTTLDTGFDLRDRLAELAIKGNALKPDDKSAIYSNLTSILGKDKAQKVMNHAYIFNNRPEVQGLSPEEKLKSFYTIGSNDPDVQEIIGRTKNLGYGAVPGFRTSVSNLNQNIQAGTYGAATGGVDPEMKKRVMVRVSK